MKATPITQKASALKQTAEGGAMLVAGARDAASKFKKYSFGDMTGKKDKPESENKEQLNIDPKDVEVTDPDAEKKGNNTEEVINNNTPEEEQAITDINSVMENIQNFKF